MRQIQRFPRRFYRRVSGGEKVLRYEIDLIKWCKWCGTFFVDYDNKMICSKECKTRYDFWMG